MQNASNALKPIALSLPKGLRAYILSLEVNVAVAWMKRSVLNSIGLEFTRHVPVTRPSGHHYIDMCSCESIT